MNRIFRRISVGAVMIAVVLAAIHFPGPYLALLVAVWIFLASREYTELVKRQGVGLPSYLLSFVNLIFPLLLVGYMALSPREPSERGFFLMLVPLAGLASYVLFARGPRAPKLVFAGFAVLYLSLLPTYLIMLRHLVYRFFWPNAFFIVLFPLLATWVNDTAAYVIGTLLGRHQLSPEISPKKTWEGFIAGVVFTVVFSVLYLPRMMGAVGVARAAVMGAVLGVAAQVGDLVESVFKREAGVKDSSSALSEHGGFLDRADSLLFTIPIFYYFLTLVLRLR
jgi:phosphatidate cytidylyltransferase